MYVEIVHPRAEYPRTDWMATAVSPPGAFDPTTAVAVMTTACDAGRRRGSVYDFGTAPMTIIGSPQSSYRPLLRPRRR